MKRVLLLLALAIPTLCTSCARYPVRNVIMTHTGETRTVTESKAVIHYH